MKEGISTIVSRWRNAMPRFFRRVFWLCSLVAGTALAVNEALTAAGIHTPWWQDIYPWVVGIPAGAAFAAKFTQTYDCDGNPVKPDQPEDKEE